MEFFDFETTSRGGVLHPFCITYTDNNKIFYKKIPNQCKYQACHILLNNFKHNYIYFAHNLIFDFFLIFSVLLEENIKYNWVFIDYNLYEVRIHHFNKIITLRCSYKLLPFALNSFFPIFSKHQKMYFPYEILEHKGFECLYCNNFDKISKKYNDSTIEEYIKYYSINDVFILRETVLSFFKNLKKTKIPFNKKSLTCSSISFLFYQKKWNKIFFGLDIKLKKILYEAYHGGRCEVYGNPRPNEKILHFDFKGMYQSCMLEPLPYDNFTYQQNNLDINIPGFYYVSVEYYNDLPILPIKTDKLYFKEGKIRGWFWFEELLLLFENSIIKSFKILKGLVALQYDVILKEFIETIEKLKNQNEVTYQIGKLLINSFYGRLAFKDQIEIMKVVKNNASYKDYAKIGDYFLIKERRTNKVKANIAMAAAISAKARIKLYKGQQEVLRNQGRLLYSDTDSIFAAFNKEHKPENKLLGNLVCFDTNKTDTVIKDAVFIAPKSYAILYPNNKETIKIKGINTNIISFSQIKEAFFKNQEYIDVDSQNISKNKFELILNQNVKRIQLQDYNKRIWIDDKFNTKPFIIF